MAISTATAAGLSSRTCIPAPRTAAMIPSFGGKPSEFVVQALGAPKPGEGGSACLRRPLLPRTLPVKKAGARRFAPRPGIPHPSHCCSGKMACFSAVPGPDAPPFSAPIPSTHKYMSAGRPNRTKIRQIIWKNCFIPDNQRRPLVRLLVRNQKNAQPLSPAPKSPCSRTPTMLSPM